MSQTSINIRMDAELKKQFDMFCNDMGLTMSTAVNIFAKKAVREYRIPFEISGDIPNQETRQAMAEVDEMIKTGTGKKFDSVESLFEELDS